MKTRMLFFFLGAAALLSMGFIAGRFSADSDHHAMIVSESNYVLSGDTFVATIQVANRLPQEARLEFKTDSGVSATTEKDSNGFIVRIPAHEEGLNSYSGTIVLKNPDNTEEKLPFGGNFIVAELYPKICSSQQFLQAGKENEIEAAVPGFAPENIVVAVTGGKIKKRMGRFYLTPDKNATQCLVEVVCESNGQLRYAGKRSFTVYHSFN
jgi:hypothetical protein